MLGIKGGGGGESINQRDRSVARMARPPNAVMRLLNCPYLNNGRDEFSNICQSRDYQCKS